MTNILRNSIVVVITIINLYTMGCAYSHEKKPTNITAKNTLSKKNKSISKNIHKPSLYLYHENYLLPFYYSTNTPIFSGIVPDNQTPNQSEVKYQISFYLPTWKNIFQTKSNHPVTLYIAYTQASYWQLYQNSAFFRATNYEPEAFILFSFRKHEFFRLGINHESNGRGGINERSWNRLFGSFLWSNSHWFFIIQPWILIFKKNNSDVYNPNIATFLGHEQITIGHVFKKNIVLTLKVQNIERLDKFLTTKLSLSFPLIKKINLYFEFFHGYGQSLIEYNHKQTSFGIGFSLSRGALE